jgi:hypothetical protein
VIRTWAKLQSLIALSSAEAEYLAMLKGVHEALALRTILLELGIETHITLYTDSAAAKGSVEKPGLMHMKHMQLRELFLKQVVQQGIVTVEKIATENNPADILTKAADKKIVERFWQNLPHRWERVFEVNLVEARPIEHLENEEENTFVSWTFLAWNIFACIGVIWLISLVQRLFTQQGDRQPNPVARRRGDPRTVATQSMSTWLRGVRDRFSLTPLADQGVFHRGLSVNTNEERDTVARSICGPT